MTAAKLPLPDETLTEWAERHRPDVQSVTQQAILDKIVKVEYDVRDGTTTWCHIHLENGFTVSDKSACVNPAKFNAQLGKEIAYANAFRLIWPLEGYLLAESNFRNQ